MACRARTGNRLQGQMVFRTNLLRLLLAIVLLAVLGKASDALLGLVQKWAVRRWA